MQFNFFFSNNFIAIVMLTISIIAPIQFIRSLQPQNDHQFRAGYHFKACTAPQTVLDFISAINLFGFWCYYPFIHNVYNFKWLKLLYTLCFISLHAIILGRIIVVSYSI